MSQITVGGSAGSVHVALQVFGPQRSCASAQVWFDVSQANSQEPDEEQVIASDRHALSPLQVTLQA